MSDGEFKGADLRGEDLLILGHCGLNFTLYNHLMKKLLEVFFLFLS